MCVQVRGCGAVSEGGRRLARCGSALAVALTLWAGASGAVRATDLPGAVAVAGAWSVVAGAKPPAAFSRRIAGMATVRPDDVWAVGWSDNARGGQATTTTPLIEHWDGNTWTTPLAPTPTDRTARLYAVTAISPDDMWAVGGIAPSADPSDYAQQPLILHFDGSAWTLIPAPIVAGAAPHASLNAVAATGPNDVWAAGRDGGAGIVAHWTGATWASVGVPSASGIVRDALDWNGISAVSAHDLWLVGERRLGQFGAGGTQPVAAHWDGIAWTLTNTPLPPGVRNGLASVAARAPNDVWAVGAVGTPPDWPTATAEMRVAPFVLHWDGTRWNSVVVPLPDTNATVVALTAVVAIAPDDVWVSGTSGVKVALGDLVSESAQAFFLHWNGTVWAIIPAPTPNAAPPTNSGSSPPFDTPAALVATSPTDLWCGGRFMGGAASFLHYSG